MKLNRLLSSGLAVGLLLACPALAQRARSPSHDLTIKSTGTAQFRGAEGFVLVEHGIWPAPLAPAVVARSKAGNQEPALAGRTKGSSLPSRNRWRRAVYLPQIAAAEARYGLPRGLLDALVWTESRYDPFAVSPAGAVGLGQLMPATASALGIENRFDPASNIFGAAHYLRQMIDQFGMVHLALAAYNAGSKSVMKARGVPSNGETPAYVRSVLQSWRMRD